jgi:hypothetical protein
VGKGFSAGVENRELSRRWDKVRESYEIYKWIRTATLYIIPPIMVELLIVLLITLVSRRRSLCGENASDVMLLVLAAFKAALLDS